MFIKSKINVKNFVNAIYLPLTLPARSFATLPNPPYGGSKTFIIHLYDTVDFNAFKNRFLSFILWYLLLLLICIR